MSRIRVSLNIDVTKIDKARLFKGAKGTYLNTSVLVELDGVDQYGNSGMITQDVSKDEREKGVKGNILGNCKLVWSEEKRDAAHVQGHAQVTQTVAPQAQPTAPPPMDDFDDEIGF